MSSGSFDVSRSALMALFISPRALLPSRKALFTRVGKLTCKWEECDTSHVNGLNESCHTQEWFMCLCVSRSPSCSVLQCVAACCSGCSVLQCVAVCCSVLQCVAVCCSVLQCIAFSIPSCIHAKARARKEMTMFFLILFFVLSREQKSNVYVYSFFF